MLRHLLNRFGNQAGVSMAETVIVLSIIAIMSAMALQRFSDDSSGVQIRSAADVLMTDMRYAHELAITRGMPVRVEIYPGQNSYALFWENTGAPLQRPVGGGSFVRVFGKDEFLHAQITETELPQGKIVFRPNGRPFVAGQQLAQKLTIASVNGQFKIEVSPVTGNIDLKKAGL